MATVTRSIVHIDEELCTGCGLCVMPCAEGAIEIIDGKAKVVKEELCDGAGFCLAVCPEGALTVEQREAPDVRRGGRRRQDGRQARRRRGHDPDLLQLRRSEMDRPLLPVRTEGRSTWVCVKCLPQLIHG